MKGSEKQVKWAEDIKAHLISTYEAAKAVMSDADKATMDKAIDKLNAVDYAGNIINAYGHIRFCGDLYKDFSVVAACHHNMSDAERRMFVPEI